MYFAQHEQARYALLSTMPLRAHFCLVESIMAIAARLRHDNATPSLCQFTASAPVTHRVNSIRLAHGDQFTAATASHISLPRSRELGALLQSTTLVLACQHRGCLQTNESPTNRQKTQNRTMAGPFLSMPLRNLRVTAPTPCEF